MRKQNCEKREKNTHIKIDVCLMMERKSEKREREMTVNCGGCLTSPPPAHFKCSASLFLRVCVRCDERKSHGQRGGTKQEGKTRSRRAVGRMKTPQQKKQKNCYFVSITFNDFISANPLATVWIVQTLFLCTSSTRRENGSKQKQKRKMKLHAVSLGRAKGFARQLRHTSTSSSSNTPRPYISLPSMQINSKTYPPAPIDFKCFPNFFFFFKTINTWL